MALYAGQFRILYRDALVRLVDIEILSSRAEVRDLVARVGGLLAALSFVLAFLIVPRYAISTLPLSRLVVAAWNDEEFLISTTITVAGLFSVLAWNAVL